MIVVKVDVDQLGDLTAKQNIEAMPTFMFFKERDSKTWLLTYGL